MAGKNLTAERVRELLAYDAETGALTWRVDRMCGRYMKQFAVRAGDPAGSVTDNGRVQIRVDGHNYKAHKVIWLHVTGEWPASEIDHWDTNGTNNRWLNLRLATRDINNQNLRRAQRNNRVGLLGVSQRRNRFTAQITIGGRNTYLGIFSTKEEAYQAYVAAKRIHHEGCTL